LSDSLYQNNTVGALDMGGASTQITFYSPDHAHIPDNYRKDMTLYGNNFTVYTHSYLCYGINEAIRQYQAILVKVGALLHTYYKHTYRILHDLSLNINFL